MTNLVNQNHTIEGAKVDQSTPSMQSISTEDLLFDAVEVDDFVDLAQNKVNVC